MRRLIIAVGTAISFAAGLYVGCLIIGRTGAKPAARAVAAVRR